MIIEIDTNVFLRTGRIVSDSNNTRSLEEMMVVEMICVEFANEIV
jgi:hypothetical protein